MGVGKDLCWLEKGGTGWRVFPAYKEGEGSSLAIGRSALRTACCVDPGKPEEKVAS